MALNDTVLIDGVDVQTVADIASLDGILSEPPSRVELVELDFTPGAVPILGPRAAYAYDLPLVMKANDENTALAQLQTVKSWAGKVITVTRKVTVGGAQQTATHQGLISDTIIPEWDFDARNLIGVVLTVWNVDGGWTGP